MQGRKKWRVIVVGGGAAGMAAGITAARQGASVTILEHMDRVGKKLLSTGNGRCNLGNRFLREGGYRCSQKSFPGNVLNRFGVKEAREFLESFGIVIKEKNGYWYPKSEQAAAVVDLFGIELKRQQIQVITGYTVQRIHFQGEENFLVQTDHGDFSGERVILAAGSKAAPFTGSDGSGYQLAEDLGHRIFSPLPALVQLRCQEKFFKQLSGVRCEGKVTLYAGEKKLAEDLGEIQLTDYGISGIPVFQVSRFASVALANKKQVKAVLDFLPSMNMEEARQFFLFRRNHFGHVKWGDFLTGILPKKLASVILKETGISFQQNAAKIPPAIYETLLNHTKAFEVTVTATNAYEQAQTCCGGVDTREIRPENLESRLVPGLYLVGELLDVDGICGGYNLQWAWTTGCLAGKSAGKVPIALD